MLEAMGRRGSIRIQDITGFHELTPDLARRLSDYDLHLMPQVRTGDSVLQTVIAAGKGSCRARPSPGLIAGDQSKAFSVVREGVNGVGVERRPKHVIGFGEAELSDDLFASSQNIVPSDARFRSIDVVANLVEKVGRDFQFFFNWKHRWGLSRERG